MKKKAEETFFGREDLLRQLSDLCAKRVASLVTCRGRRRVGKSTLIEVFARRNGFKFIKIEGKRPEKGMSEADELATFARQLAIQTGIDISQPLDWPDAFSRLNAQLRGRERMVVLLDEISWLAYFSPGFASDLKIAWDNLFKKHDKLVLVLCGSVSSWLKENVVDNSAFFGRRSLDMVVPELPLAECVKFWGKRSSRIAVREIIDVLSVTGGIPRYLEEINPSLKPDLSCRAPSSSSRPQSGRRRAVAAVRFSVLCAVLSLAATKPATAFGSARDVAREALANEIVGRVGKAVGNISGRRAKARGQVPDAARVRTGEWAELWPSGTGRGIVTNVVRGELWSAAIQATLEAKGAVYVPARSQPYYLDEPIVLSSGQILVADPCAEFRLVSKSNRCLVRNRSVVGIDRTTYAVPDVPYDANVYVEGGVWTFIQTQRGVDYGSASERPRKASLPDGCYGALLFNHVRGLAVRNVTIRRCPTHGIQLSDVHGFLVDGVTFQSQGRDGVHHHGGCDWGVVRNIRGETYDDMIALNAWDWFHTSPALGPIHHVLVERVNAAAFRPGEGANGCRSIRLLPGNKRRADGTVCACPVSDVVIRDCENFGEIKMYDQPNLELGRDKDRSQPIGSFRNVYFHRLRFDLATEMQVADHVDGLDVSDVVFTYPRTKPFVRIGPISATWKTAPDPSTWVDIFSPDESFTVRGFSLRNVRTLIGGVETELDPKTMYAVRDGRLNPDYPKTTPRGGTGKVNFSP